jgi:small nuclear ribonucleoprotein (snRNP)-like protein
MATEDQDMDPTFDEAVNNDQNSSIAVIQNDIRYIRGFLRGIDRRLEIMDGNFVKRDEFLKYQQETEKRSSSHDLAIRKLELDATIYLTQVKTWGTMAIIVLGVLQFIIGKFL